MSTLDRSAQKQLVYQPAQVRYFQALLPTQRRCLPQCPKHKALDSSCQQVPLPSPHRRQTAPPAGMKKQKQQLKARLGN